MNTKKKTKSDSMKNLPGPKTKAGKTIARRNAMQHGLRASAILLTNESEQDFRNHLIGIRESLKPIGFLELQLAEEIANILWRKKRIDQYEASSCRERLESNRRRASRVAAKLDSPESWLVIPSAGDLAAMSNIPDGVALDKICRYETHLTRQLDRALHRLEKLQAQRSGSNNSVMIVVENPSNQQNCQTNLGPVIRDVPMKRIE